MSRDNALGRLYSGQVEAVELSRLQRIYADSIAVRLAEHGVHEHDAVAVLTVLEGSARRLDALAVELSRLRAELSRVLP